MITAVIYSSKSGFSRQYAEIIAKELNINMYNIKEAKEKLIAKSEIIYVAGITVTKIRELSRVNRLFRVQYVIGVGMTDYSEEYENTIFSNNINISDKFYYTPGGYDATKTKGLDKFLISLLKLYYKQLKKDAKKRNKELLPKDQDIINILEKGYSNKVSEKYLERFFKEVVL